MIYIWPVWHHLAKLYEDFGILYRLSHEMKPTQMLLCITFRNKRAKGYGWYYNRSIYAKPHIDTEAASMLHELRNQWMCYIIHYNNENEQSWIDLLDNFFFFVVSLALQTCCSLAKYTILLLLELRAQCYSPELHWGLCDLISPSNHVWNS